MVTSQFFTGAFLNSIKLITKQKVDNYIEIKYNIYTKVKQGGGCNDD